MEAAEELSEILLNPNGQLLDGFAEQFRGEVIDRAEVRRVINRSARSGVGQRMSAPLFRQQLVRRIRLDKQSVGPHMAKGLPLTFLALVREVAGQREVRPELRQRRNHFRRTTVGVQEKSAGWTRARLQQLQHAAPGLETMDADRQLAFCRETKLPDEDFLLRRQVVVFDPSIEPDFANGRRDFIQRARENVAPAGRPLLHIPRMVAERRDDLRMFPGEREDVRPVLFARAVDDHAHDAFLRRRRHERRDIGAESRILQMIVSVVDPHVFLGSDGGFQQQRGQVIWGVALGGDTIFRPSGFGSKSNL